MKGKQVVEHRAHRVKKARCRCHQKMGQGQGDLQVIGVWTVQILYHGADSQQEKEEIVQCHIVHGIGRLRVELRHLGYGRQCAIEQQQEDAQKPEFEGKHHLMPGFKQQRHKGEGDQQDADDLMGNHRLAQHDEAIESGDGHTADHHTWSE